MKIQSCFVLVFFSFQKVHPTTVICAVGFTAFLGLLTCKRAAAMHSNRNSFSVTWFVTALRFAAPYYESLMQSIRVVTVIKQSPFLKPLTARLHNGLRSETSSWNSTENCLGRQNVITHLESGQVSKVNTFHLDIKSLMTTCGKDICSTSRLGILHIQSYCASVVMLEYWFSIGLKENCSQLPAILLGQPHISSGDSYLSITRTYWSDYSFLQKIWSSVLLTS